MAVGYYDPNKDYSKAISEAKAAGKDTSKLEAERQNKIDDKYGGKEPNMWGSDKTYSQASRDNDRDTIDNAISVSNGRGSSSSSTSGNRATNLPGNAQPAQATTTPLAPAQLPALSQYGFRDMDYSSVIPTVTDAALRQQLLQERDNKIKYQYGNAEPNMIGSNQKFSQTQAGSSSGQSSGTWAVGSTKDLVKGPGYVTGGYTMGVNGSPILNDNPYWKGGVSASKADMSRRPDLAGGYATSNGYTVFYDENGYATHAIKGVADFLPNKDLNASNGTYNKIGAWTDNEILTPEQVALIQSYRDAANAGTMTWADANAKANAIRAGYGYTIDNQGNVTNSGVLTAVNDRREQLGLPVNDEDAYAQYYRYLMGTDTSPLAQASGNVQTLEQFLSNGGLTGSAAIPSQALVSGGNQAGGISSLEYGAGSDAYQYIRDMFAQQAAAQLAALKSTYEQNVLDYQAQDDLISAEAQRQRNQAAAQNEIQRMYMNEMGIMQGLNTGTTGQMALARSAALQGNLASIGTQEQQALSDSALERSKLKAQYSAAVDQAVAQNNYELANALYQEYVRQDTLAQQKAAAALEQQNWLDKFNYQKEQDALAQQNWQAQFDYQKQQDALDYQMALMKLNAKNGTGGTTRTGGSTTTYDNGSMTTEQVKQLQQKLGVNPDGKWGTQSSAAAGGLTADEAWAKYGGYDMSFEELKSNITRYLSLGGAQRAQNILDSHWDILTPAQQLELSNLFG